MADSGVVHPKRMRLWVDVPDAERLTVRDLTDGLMKPGFHSRETARAQAKEILSVTRGCKAAVQDRIHGAGKWRQCKERPRPSTDLCARHAPPEQLQEGEDG